jgi:solute carrier family 6 (neurotransmitter transporter, glycine) member 5/9
MQSHDNYGYVQTVPGELKFGAKQYSVDQPGVFYARPDQDVNDEKVETEKQSQSTEALAETGHDRENWGKGIEFLLSCIAMSVGLGNVWRFPFVALENGGGAFVFPYIVVLLVVGKPIYFMEMVIGQFSSRGSVKVYDFAPAMRGNY